MYVRGLELFGKLDSETINNLFGNLDEVIRVNDGLEDELNNLRDHRGNLKKTFWKFFSIYHLLIFFINDLCNSIFPQRCQLTISYVTYRVYNIGVYTNWRL